MRFFFYSQYGDILSTAQRVQAEGNEVELLIADLTPGASPGLGLVPLATDLSLRPDTIIVFDMVGAGNLADSLRREGWPVLGGGSFNDRVELDHRAGSALMRMSGIATPETVAFNAFEDARKFIRQHSTYLVFKPNVDHAGALTKVFPNLDDLERHLFQLEQRWAQDVDFVLQEKVSGLEVSIEGWFNGDDWLFGSFNSTVEEKHFLTGGLGPRVGSAGNVTFFYKHGRPALAKKTLLRLTRFLRQKSYRGPINVSTIGGKGIGFTARFGYDAWQTAIGLLEGDLGRLLSDVARGQTRRMRTSFDYGVGVRLSVPPYPTKDHDALTAVRGRPVEIAAEVSADFHASDIMVGTLGPVVAGQSGIVGVMTHHAAQVSGLSKVYKKIERMNVDELQYRTDILTNRAQRDVLATLRAVSVDTSEELEEALTTGAAGGPPAATVEEATETMRKREVGDPYGPPVTSSS